MAVLPLLASLLRAGRGPAAARSTTLGREALHLLAVSPSAAPLSSAASKPQCDGCSSPPLRTAQATAGRALRAVSGVDRCGSIDVPRASRHGKRLGARSPAAPDSPARGASRRGGAFQARHRQRRRQWRQAIRTAGSSRSIVVGVADGAGRGSGTTFTGPATASSSPVCSVMETSAVGGFYISWGLDWHDIPVQVWHIFSLWIRTGDL